MREAVRAAFHPDGDYAIILNNANIVHVLDWETQEATRFDLTPPEADDVFWTDLAFDPSGEFALMVGYVMDGGADEGVVYRFDDNAWRSLNNQEAIFQNGIGSDLEYCIVRPGGLTVDAPTGVINVIKGEAGSIARADVADFCLGAVLDADFPYVKQAPCISSVGGTAWTKDRSARAREGMTA